MLNWAVFWFRRDQASSIEQLAEAFHAIYLDGAAAPPSADRVLLNLPANARKHTAKTKPSSRGVEKSTPERMLDRAAALFASKGYAATSTREIAAGLGMRKASLYYHIETKEDLLYAICESSLIQIRQDVESALSVRRPPMERVRALVDAHTASLLRDQDKHSATLAEMHTLSPERRAKLAALRDDYEDLVRGVLSEAQAAGALRSDIPIPFLCLSLLGLLNRVVIWYRPGGSLSPAQLGQLMSEVFLNGVARHPSTDRQVKSRRR
jgi:AcrR family transcriptional regulator